MAIYYVFISLLWFFYFDRLDKDVDNITKEIHDKDVTHKKESRQDSPFMLALFLLLIR